MIRFDVKFARWAFTSGRGFEQNIKLTECETKSIESVTATTLVLMVKPNYLKPDSSKHSIASGQWH